MRVLRAMLGELLEISANAQLFSARNVHNSRICISLVGEGARQMTLTFLDFELDLEAGELRQAGLPVDVEPQVLELIATLASNAGRVMSKDGLIEKVWLGRTVSDSTVSSRINTARRVLGDDGASQRIIKTIHGRGFRFELSALTADVGDQSEQSLNPSPVFHGPSIAVLPFADMSGDGDFTYFADGISDDIISGLARFRELNVVSRSSTFAYRDALPNIRQIADDLGVRYIIEGSVRRLGDRLRVTSQLVDSQSAKQIWASRYDEDIGDLFAIQDEITEAIVASIAPEIGQSERRQAQRKHPENLDVWDRYQNAQVAYNLSTSTGLETAIEQFDKVTELDPNFAPGFAMAAGARWRYAIHFQPENWLTLLETAKQRAYTAMAMDSRDALGFLHAGEVHSTLGQHTLAVSLLEEAVALNPADAIARYMLGSGLKRKGQLDDALVHFGHAMRLSPHDFWITGMRTDYAFVLFALKRYDEAYEWAERARLSGNPRTMTFAIHAATSAKLGKPDEAARVVRELLEHAPGLTCAKYRANRFGTPEAMEHLVDSLRVAGLPD
jgi:TolB-like protein